MVTQGSPAPDFRLEDADGKAWSLADFRGRTLVLYFYPKDDTSGCTKEACGFRDAWADYRGRDIAVVGISPDSVASHSKFAGKYSLPFTLLADPEHRALEAYGAWGEKSMYGRKYMGVIRSTFVIDGNGMVVKVFPKVSPEGHAKEILESI